MADVQIYNNGPTHVGFRQMQQDASKLLRSPSPKSYPESCHTMLSEFYTIGRTGWAAIHAAGNGPIDKLNALQHSSFTALGQCANHFFANGVSLGQFDSISQLSSYLQSAPPGDTTPTLPPVPTTTTTTAPPQSVVISVTGSGPATNVTYQVGFEGNTTQNTQVALPYTLTLPGPPPSYVIVMAQTSSGSASANISCSISAPGTLFASSTNTSTGPYSTVQCQKQFSGP